MSDPNAKADGILDDELDIYYPGMEPNADDDLPEDVKNLSKKELYEKMQEIKNQGSQTQNFTDAIDRIANMQKPQQMQNVPQTIEKDPLVEFLKDKDKISAKMIESPDELFREFASLSEQRTAKMVANATVENSIQLLKVQSDTKDVVTKYEGEIRGLLSQVDPMQRANPEVIQGVIRMVKGSHTSELMESEVERQVKERLKALGIDEEGTKVVKATVKAPVTEGYTPQTTRAAGKGPTVKLTDNDMERARRSGMVGAPDENGKYSQDEYNRVARLKLKNGGK
jgi:hypothetical protein